MMVRKRKGSFWPALPLPLLLLALATVFLFGDDREHFYRPGSHNFITAQSMSLAANLSPEHGFLMFSRRYSAADGMASYEPYTRFPIGTYALIKLVIILPFADDLAAQIYAARLLMLSFFAATATLAYLALSRLFANRWIALTATFLSFSSYICLYYSDMVSTEVATSLFGVLLTFHGMVVFVQDGRFRQLLVKACVATLLGWHVMALILPFVFFSLTKELLQAYSANLPPPEHMFYTSRIRSVAATLLSSRYLQLGIVSLLFCVLMMGFNFGTEYFALNGEIPLTELPTVKSMLKRIGVDDVYLSRYPHLMDWRPFLTGQISRIGGLSIPYFLLQLFGYEYTPHYRTTLFLLGAVVFVVGLLGLFFVRHKILTATALLSGWCWAAPLRASAAIHDFEILFHIGIPLVFFALVSLPIRRLSGDRLIEGLAIVAGLVFVLSSIPMARVGLDAKASERYATLTADFERIRAIVQPGRSVFVAMRIGGGVGPWARGESLPLVTYYLVGRIFARDRSAYDFLISDQRLDGPALLTPENGQVFLYDSTAYSTLIDEMIAKSELISRSDFDVYRSGNSLIYTRERCRGDDDGDVNAWFFLHIVPVDMNDLPDHRKQYGFDHLDFRLDDHRISFIDRCVAMRDLPDYDIASVRTGQYTEEGQLWEAEFGAEASERYATMAADFERIRAIVQPGRSVVVALRSGGAGQWSDESSMTLVNDYLAGRNLTRDRSAYDFLISDQRIDGPALLTPENGQMFLYHGIEYSTLIDEMIAKSELVFRSDFDMYRSGNSLIYTRERCRGDDDAGWFFLHIVPVDVNDLPDHRKQYGFDHLDFRFDEYRIPFIDRCVAVRDLPAYDIAGVRTGQSTEEGQQLWKAEFGFAP